VNRKKTARPERPEEGQLVNLHRLPGQPPNPHRFLIDLSHDEEERERQLDSLPDPYVLTPESVAISPWGSSVQIDVLVRRHPQPDGQTKWESISMDEWFATPIEEPDEEGELLGWLEDMCDEECPEAAHRHLVWIKGGELRRWIVEGRDERDLHDFCIDERKPRGNWWKALDRDDPLVKARWFQLQLAQTFPFFRPMYRDITDAEPELLAQVAQMRPEFYTDAYDLIKRLRAWMTETRSALVSANHGERIGAEDWEEDPDTGAVTVELSQWEMEESAHVGRLEALLAAMAGPEDAS
jgi:hypothetical protein